MVSVVSQSCLPMLYIPHISHTHGFQVSGYQEGKIEWESLHTGCGVKKGEKWACNVWMYNKPFHDEVSDSVLAQWGLQPFPQAA